MTLSGYVRQIFFRFGSRGIAVSLVSAGEEEKKLQLIAARCNATILPLLDVSRLSV